MKKRIIMLVITSLITIASTISVSAARITDLDPNTNFTLQLSPDWNPTISGGDDFVNPNPNPGGGNSDISGTDPSNPNQPALPFNVTKIGWGNVVRIGNDIQATCGMDYYVEEVKAISGKATLNRIRYADTGRDVVYRVRNCLPNTLIQVKFSKIGYKSTTFSFK